MSREFFIRWLKYALAATLFFIAAGFALKVGVEGFTPQEAFELLVELGLYQSILYAMVVATLLTVRQS